MGKDRQEKLKRYIKDDRPQKLKSYVKKYEICLSEIHLSRGKSLLHYACKHSSGSVIRYLLTEGLDPDSTDDKLNFPLHIALTKALRSLNGSQQVFTEIVLPLLNRFSAPLDIPNKAGVTCRYLLNQLRTRQQLFDQTGEINLDSDSSVDSEDKWQKKLAEELNEDCNDEKEFGSDYSEAKTETYDEWADRITREHHLKSKYSHVPLPPRKKTKTYTSSGASTSRSQAIDEEELRRIRERLQRNYKNTQKEDQFERKRRKKILYEKNYTQLLQDNQDRVLTFEMVPWPCVGSVSDMKDILFCDIEDRSSKVFRKYLRDQQVRWHPDKFMQKFGKILKPEDESKILHSVKEISQELNKISESLPQTT